MNGKVLRVKQTSLEFGGQERKVNILGCFKYKANGNIYIIYSDIDTRYSVIYYGSGHVRGDLALCMPIRDKEIEEEITKEYIFKITQKENLDNFEILSLNEAKEIEIIGSTKLEVKPEILQELIQIVIPKEHPQETPIKKEVKKKKGNPLKDILLGLLIVVFIFGGYYIYNNITTANKMTKSITCSKNYQHNELKADVEETNKYIFNNNDELKNVDTTLIYQFTQENYEEFIIRGLYLKYMPSKEENWDKNDEDYTFKTITKINIDASYSEPTNYEDVLSYYRVKGYTCIEEVPTK